MKIMAKNIEMGNLVKHLEKIGDTSVRAISDVMNNKDCAEIISVFTRYNHHVFNAEGEQLRERRGFFLHSEVRGIFQSITKIFPSFCNDIYTTLSIQRETIEEFYDYCSKKSMRKLSVDEEDTWRKFILILERICLVFHVLSRKEEVGDFIVHYGSTDGYFREMIRRIR